MPAVLPSCLFLRHTESEHTGDMLMVTWGQHSWAMVPIQLLNLHSFLSVVYLFCKEQSTWTRWPQVFGDTIEVNSSLRAIGFSLNSLGWRLALEVDEPELKRTDSCRTLGPEPEYPCLRPINMACSLWRLQGVGEGGLLLEFWCLPELSTNVCLLDRERSKLSEESKGGGLASSRGLQMMPPP